jgi:hypothetical protein
MVAIPATGGTFVQAGFNDRGPEFLRRGNPVAVLCRDARGAATDISPHNPDGSVLFSPFATDNTWRTDLLAVKKSGGYYTTNLSANEGFFNLGAFKDGDGPSWKPGVKNDHFMILQDNFPYDTMLTDESEPFSLTPVDTASPWVQRLRNNRPYSDSTGVSLMEDPGQSGAGFSRLLSGNNPGRQFLFIRERMWNGLPIYSVQGVALARMDDIGASKLDKKDSEGAPLTYLPLPDGRFSAVQDGSYQSILVHTWWGGAGWNALGGVPIFTAVAPVATPGVTGKASIAVDTPTGTGDPFTYTAEKAVSPYTSWSAAAPDGATYATPGVVVTASGTTTVKVASVTAGATKFRVIATGTNGGTATSLPSNAATIT